MMMLFRCGQKVLSVRRHSWLAPSTKTNANSHHQLSTAFGNARFLSTQHHQQQQYDGWSSSSLPSGSMIHFAMGIVAATGAAVSSHSNNNDSSDNNDYESYTLFPPFGRTTAVPTRCEPHQQQDNVEDDPYENLPDEDEPTHCSICLTYRQGPCRPYWRKVEACTKDNELPEKKQENDNKENGDEDDEDNRPDPPCLKYMMPWIDCASGYRNLYALIELDTNYTEGIQDLEATSQGFCWVPGQEPSVDWSPWQDYVELINPQWKLPKKRPLTFRPNKKDTTTNGNDQSTPTPKADHFWKSLDHSSDPELVQVEATIPTMLGSGILECGYALDQDGNVIGFVYGTKPSEAAKGAKASGKSDKTSSDEQDDTADTTARTVTMTIRLFPGGTRHVVLAAAYTHAVVDDDEKGKRQNGDVGGKTKGGDSNTIDYESHVYKSRPIRLDVVADRDTKINVAAA
jgi:hypothetical protein